MVVRESIWQTKLGSIVVGWNSELETWIYYLLGIIAKSPELLVYWPKRSFVSLRLSPCFCFTLGFFGTSAQPFQANRGD